jgi:hypothetical protein
MPMLAHPKGTQKEPIGARPSTQSRAALKAAISPTSSGGDVDSAGLLREVSTRTLKKNFLDAKEERDRRTGTTRRPNNMMPVVPSLLADISQTPSQQNMPAKLSLSHPSPSFQRERTSTASSNLPLNSFEFTTQWNAFGGLDTSILEEKRWALLEVGGGMSVSCCTVLKCHVGVDTRINATHV